MFFVEAESGQKATHEIRESFDFHSIDPEENETLLCTLNLVFLKKVSYTFVSWEFFVKTYFYFYYT
jgi:hypothetical protein